jgi:hypothetical protein
MGYSFSHPNRGRVQERRKTRSKCSLFRRKIVYANPDLAEAAAAEMAAIYQQEFRAYPCDRCRCWHVGRP